MVKPLVSTRGSSGVKMVVARCSVALETENIVPNSGHHHNRQLYLLPNPDLVDGVAAGGPCDNRPW